MKYIPKIDDPFLYDIPVLDLHGEMYETSKVLTKIFIEEAVKLKNEKVAIIHGIGKGIVKDAVHTELKINKYVLSYKIDSFNGGITIVNLR